MQIEQEPREFDPIFITIETAKEAQMLAEFLWNHGKYHSWREFEDEKPSQREGFVKMINDLFTGLSEGIDNV